MFYTVSIILTVLWAAGLITSYTLGGYIHILLAAAILIAGARFYSTHRHTHA